MKVLTDEKYINREIAWLSFNKRVLMEAADETNPVVERMIFLGIFSSNNDEFCRVRVASLKREIEKKNNENRLEHKKLLKEIRAIINEQLLLFEQIFEWNAIELSKQKIHILEIANIAKWQEDYIKNYFRQHVRRHIYPIYIDRIKDDRMFSDKSNYLVLQMWKSTKSKFAKDRQEMIIEIPVEKTTRFLKLPSKNGHQYIMMLDDVIRYCIDDILSPLGYDSYEAYSFKFLRDAELDIDYSLDSDTPFVDLLSMELQKRNKSKTVRLVHDSLMPKPLLKKLQNIFGAKDEDTFNSRARYQNKKDFVKFPRDFEGKNLSELMYPSFIPLDLKHLPIGTGLFEVLRQRDIMLHYPYQSFQHIIDLVREASMDKNVKAIKMAIYRVAKDSSIMNALVNAARNGKKVSVFMELMARFDEANNINWARRLEAENIEVYKIIPGVKVHAKILLIERLENRKKQLYAALGTGNPNETTAKQYCDLQLLTSNEKITKEVEQVFRSISKPLKTPFVDYKELLVSPFTLRSSFEKLIENEINNAKNGKKAWMKICLNNLADQKMIDYLYKASSAGVKIEMVVRGICMLKPGVKNLSENISLVSIVDRFLEHTRIFIFANDSKPLYFIGSADWMTRNLDHRIEVVCPIYDKGLQKDLLKRVNLQLMDNTHARILSDGTTHQYKQRRKGERKIRSQEAMYEYLKKKYS